MHVSHGFALTTSYPPTVATGASCSGSPVHVSRGFPCTTSSHGVGMGAGEFVVNSPKHI